jgi:class 3 adenylate cyclase
MHVEIRGLHETKLGAEQLIIGLNSFLNFFSPMIRQHGGFVKRYTYDGMRSIFKHPEKAVLAARDIKLGMETYNRLHGLNFTVGISIHTAEMPIATIGEEGRFDCVIMSEQSSIPECINTVNHKKRIDIIVSGQTTTGRASQTRKRYIGKIRDKNDAPFDSFEVFTDDDAKIRTIGTFDQGVRLFEEQKYFTAFKMFNAVLEDNTEDSVAGQFVAICSQAMEQCEKRVEQIEMVPILEMPGVLPAFEDYCENERSTENVELWKRIRASQKETDYQHFKERVHEIILRSEDINVSNSTKEKLRNAVRTDQITVDILNDLQVEVELNMKDTYTRFKRTDLGMDSIARGLGVIIKLLE